MSTSRVRVLLCQRCSAASITNQLLLHATVFLQKTFWVTFSWILSFLCTVRTISVGKQDIRLEDGCTLWETADTIRPYRGRRSQSGCGNSGVSPNDNNKLRNEILNKQIKLTNENDLPALKTMICIQRYSYCQHPVKQRKEWLAETKRKVNIQTEGWFLV